MTVYNYMGNDKATATMYIGYYQDESHRGGRAVTTTAFRSGLSLS